MSNSDSGRRPWAPGQFDIGDGEEDRIWALPRERVMPLDTKDMVKASSLALDRQVDDITPAQRLVASRRICARAGELGIGDEIADGVAYKYAGSRLSPHFHAFLAMRKEATCHAFDKELDKLLEVGRFHGMKHDLGARVKGLDKVASVLAQFDADNGLEDQWGRWMPDPAYSAYGQTADRNEPTAALDQVKVAGFDVTRSVLDSVDWQSLSRVLAPEVVDGMSVATDKLAVFASLPDPEKEIITQRVAGAEL